MDAFRCRVIHVLEEALVSLAFFEQQGQRGMEMGLKAKERQEGKGKAKERLEGKGKTGRQWKDEKAKERQEGKGKTRRQRKDEKAKARWKMDGTWRWDLKEIASP